MNGMGRCGIELWPLAAASILAGCVSLPSRNNPEAYHDAIGYVTISTPQFIPLEGSVQGDKRLKFGLLRDEEKLAAQLQKPSVGISLLKYEALKTALQARFAGPQLEKSETITESLKAQEFKQELDRQRKRTFTSPEAPSEPLPVDAVPDPVQNALVKLLSNEVGEFTLPPDDVATLVAAYKTLMVNLEEYFNVDGYGYDDGSDYVPYKVHFTVSAEPGWYTRYHPSEAVVEMEFSGQSDVQVIDREFHDDYKVLTVIPPETSQTIEQLSAALESFTGALTGEGGFQSVAGRLDVQYIRQLAERLEGLRANKTLIVAYPASNKARIRFRPSFIPAKRAQDLQPTSRMLTALVLVKNTIQRRVREGKKKQRFQKESLGMISRKDEDRLVAIQEKQRPFIDELNRKLASKSESDPKWSQAIKSRIGPGAPGLVQEPLTTLMQEAGVDAKLVREAEKLEQELTLPFRPRQCTVGVGAYFVPALYETASGITARRFWGFFSSGPYERLDCNDPNVAKGQENKVCVVPPWFGPSHKKLEIASAFGYYWGDFAAPQKLLESVANAEDQVKKASEELAAADQELNGLRKKLEDEVDSAEKKRLRKNIKKAEEKRKDRASRLDPLRQKAARLKTQSNDASYSAIASCSAAIGFRLLAPRLIPPRSGGPYPSEASVYVRLSGGKQHGRPADAWRLQGRGDLSRTYETNHLDLSVALSPDDVKKGAGKIVRAFLEAALVVGEDPPKPDGSNIVQTAVIPVDLDPHFKVPPTPSPPAPAPPKKIEVDLESVKLELSGTEKAAAAGASPPAKDAAAKK